MKGYYLSCRGFPFDAIHQHGFITSFHSPVASDQWSESLIRIFVFVSAYSRFYWQKSPSRVFALIPLEILHILHSPQMPENFI
jgi:hypothetical protein